MTKPRRAPTKQTRRSAPAAPPHPAPAAPPSLNSRVVHNQVAGVAVGVFSRLGFAATRVEDLIDAAQISRRTFYKYFDSKDAVLAAVYELATTELLAAVRDAVANAGSPFEGVRQGIDLYLDFHAQNGTLLKILVEHGFRSESPLAPLRKRFRTELAAIAARAADTPRGHTRPDPLYFLALLSALEGLSLEVLDRVPPDPRDVARAKTVAHTLLARALERPA